MDPLYLATFLGSKRVLLVTLQLILVPGTLTEKSPIHSLQLPPRNFPNFPKLSHFPEPFQNFRENALTDKFLDPNRVTSPPPVCLAYLHHIKVDTSRAQVYILPLAESTRPSWAAQRERTKPPCQLSETIGVGRGLAAGIVYLILTLSILTYERGRAGSPGESDWCRRAT